MFEEKIKVFAERIKTLVDNISTEEEMQSYYIVKSILGEVADLNRITWKDTVSYFTILIDGKVTRWICRVYLKENVRYVIIPNDTENIKYPIEKIEDLYKLSDIIKKRALSLL